jgi:ankyrin repeat protein
MSKARLFEAARSLDLGAIRRELATKPALLSATDPQGRNLLLVVCSVDPKTLGLPASRSVQLAEHLLDAGLDVESTKWAEGYPCTAAWFAAAKAKSTKLVELLVRRGAKPRGLFAAGWNNDLAMLELLIDLGAEVDEQFEGETPVLHCWKNKRFKPAEFLLRAGADVNFRDPKGMSALHYALDRLYDPAMIKLLVKHGASPAIVDGDGVSATEKAARKRNPAYRAALG